MGIKAAGDASTLGQISGCNVYEELKVCTSLLLCHSQGVKAAKSGRDWASSIKLSVYLCVCACATRYTLWMNNN